MVTFRRTGYTIAHACYYRSGRCIRWDTIVFGPGASIQHSCPPPANGNGRDQAAAHLDAIFSGQVRWTILDGQLALSGNKGTVLLQPVGAEQSSLTSSAWQLTSTTFDGQTRAAVGDVELAFPTPQSLLVKRCYQSSAPVTVQKSTLTVRFLRTSLARPCPYGPPGTQTQNAAIDSVLRRDGELGGRRQPAHAEQGRRHPGVHASTVRSCVPITRSRSSWARAGVPASGYSTTSI